MTDEQILFKLLQHGPLLYPQLREITGWPEARIKKACEWGTRPRGSIARELLTGARFGRAVWWIFRAKTDEELRRLPARASRSDRLATVRPGLPHLRGQVSMAPAAHARPEGGARRAAALGAQMLDGLRAPRAGAAGAGQAGLETVGEPWQ